MTSVQWEPNQQDPDPSRYLVRARFQHQDEAVLVMISPSGMVDGLELQPSGQG